MSEHGSAFFSTGNEQDDVALLMAGFKSAAEASNFPKTAHPVIGWVRIPESSKFSIAYWHYVKPSG